MSEPPLDHGLEVGNTAANRSRALTLKLDFKANWVWAALVVLLSAWIIQSFFLPLVWAAIIAIATWPLYRRFALRMPARLASTVTPAVFTVLISSFLLGPMVFAFGAVAVEAQSWLDRLALADKTGLAVPACPAR